MKKLLISLLALLAFSAFATVDTEICVGDRVINRSHQTGVVREIFSNGQARVRIDGHVESSIRSLSNLGYAISCSNEAPCDGTN